MVIIALEDEEAGARIVAFLTIAEQKKLRVVCRRWYYTCTWLQYADGALELSKKSALNLRSRRFQHIWTHCIKAKSHAFLEKLVQSLPPPSKGDTYALKMGLCESTNTGVRPSFDNPHARSGYTISKINRCGNFPGLLLSQEMRTVRAEIFSTNSTKKRWQIALYGGGPGYDSVGMIFLMEFLRTGDLSLHTNVYDNEPGWAEAVAGADRALQDIGYTSATWSFKACDITEDIGASINTDVDADIETTDFSATGSLFVFIDSTHRLWHLIWEVAQQSSRFRIWVPYVRGCHYVLVLKKLLDHEDPSAFPFYDDAIERLATFSTHFNLQLASLNLSQ